MNLDAFLLCHPDVTFSPTFTAELSQVIQISQFAHNTLSQYAWMLPIIERVQTQQTPLHLVNVLQLTQVQLGYTDSAEDAIATTLSETQQLTLLRASRHLGMLLYLWRDVLNQQSIETSLDLV